MHGSEQNHLWWLKDPFSDIMNNPYFSPFTMLYLYSIQYKSQICSHLVMALTASNVAYTLEQWLSYVPWLAYTAKCVLDCEPDLDIVIVGMYVICLLCAVANLWWVLGCPGTTALQGFILLHIKSTCVIKWCSTHWRWFCSKTNIS